MKTIVGLILSMFLFASPLFADTYCEWTGTEGTNCRSDAEGYLRAPDGHKITVAESNLNSFGYYKLTITNPVLGDDQVTDQEVWVFIGNDITMTWIEDWAMLRASSSSSKCQKCRPWHR